jgi:bacterioferritin-associated ferredoxin
MLLLHNGVVPNINLAAAAGCTLAWDATQACFRPHVDIFGASSVDGITIAGDGAGIGGARVAEAQGRLAALNAAFALGRIDAVKREHNAKGPLRELARWSSGRAFIDAMYCPSDSFIVPENRTIVCRCEEVTADVVRQAIRMGCQGPNQLKSFLRCGMGPCQGRFCGLTVNALFADELKITPEQAGYYRLRFPIKPLTLRELAALPQTSESMQAVVRLPRPPA